MELAQIRPSRHWSILVVIAVAASTAACGGGDDETTTTSPVTVPATTSPPPTVPTTTAIPAPTSEPTPERTVPPESVSIRDGLQLTPGWSYRTDKFDVPFTWTMPDHADLGRWGTVFDTQNYVVVTLKLTDAASPEIIREEPGFSVSAMPPGVGVADSIELVRDSAVAYDTFTVEESVGAFLGSEVSVSSGTYDIGDPGRGAIFLRLTDSFSVPAASGERRFLSYFVPVDDRVVRISINGHAVDFDLLVTLAGQVLDTLEFE